MNRIALLTSALLVLASTLANGGEKTPRPEPRPNLLIDASAAAINAAVQRFVDRTEAFEEEIQETPVCGIGRTQGLVSAWLCPDSARASIDLVFRGQIDARSVGTRPQVLIHTIDTTPLEVRRRITIDQAGIYSAPGPNFGYTATELLGVTNRFGDMGFLQIEFTRRAFVRNKHLAENEAACKAAARVSDRLGQETAPTLASVSQAAQNKLAHARQIGLKLESMKFQTTAASLQASLRFTTPGAEPTAIPEMPSEMDLGLRVHEGLFNEIARAEYGGRATRVEHLSEFYEEVTQGLLRKEDKDQLKAISQLVAALAVEPVTATLAVKDPLIVSIDGQGFKIDIHVRAIRHGKTLYSGMRLKATYKLANVASGVHAVRQGPVQIVLLDPPGKQENVGYEPLPAYTLFFVELLAGQVLKERLILNALPFSSDLPELRFGPPRAGARDGWFAIAWKLK